MVSTTLSELKRLELICLSVEYCQVARSNGMPVSCYSKALREPIHFLWERRHGTKVQSAKYRSRSALMLKYGNSEIVYDHAVPFKYLQAELLALRTVSAFTVRDLLVKYDTIVLISKDENERLNLAGYGSAMPSGWEYGDDPLARYNETNIEIVSSWSCKTP